eukprot:scaffold153670_cov33-Tisochrysis_lutea.AAC.3
MGGGGCRMPFLTLILLLCHSFSFASVLAASYDCRVCCRGAPGSPLWRAASLHALGEVRGGSRSKKTV